MIVTFNDLNNRMAHNQGHMSPLPWLIVHPRGAYFATILLIPTKATSVDFSARLNSMHRRAKRVMSADIAPDHVTSVLEASEGLGEFKPLQRRKVKMN